jgi:hypothetical protein
VAGDLSSIAYSRLAGVLPDELQAIFWKELGQDVATFLLAWIFASTSPARGFYPIYGSFFV